MMTYFDKSIPDAEINAAIWRQWKHEALRRPVQATLVRKGFKLKQ